MVKRGGSLSSGSAGAGRAEQFGSPFHARPIRQARTLNPAGTLMHPVASANGDAKKLATRNDTIAGPATNNETARQDNMI